MRTQHYDFNFFSSLLKKGLCPGYTPITNMVFYRFKNHDYYIYRLIVNARGFSVEECILILSCSSFDSLYDNCSDFVEFIELA